MQILELAPFTDAKAIEHACHDDGRGSFAELWREDLFRDAGIEVSFCQENFSLSLEPGTVRGLHFQIGSSAQAKLVRCAQGAIFDVIVDLRRSSPTFGRHASFVLDPSKRAQIFVPAGFAHGFCTLAPRTEVIYKTSAYYDPAAARGLAWDDPALAIAWPVAHDRAILLPRDCAYPRLGELPPYFA